MATRGSFCPVAENKNAQRKLFVILLEPKDGQYDLTDPTAHSGNYESIYLYYQTIYNYIRNIQTCKNSFYVTWLLKLTYTLFNFKK